MANPMYSPHLEYAPTFRWGGREWDQDDLSAFIKKIGGPKKYDKWARRHRIAAKTFDPSEGAVYSQIQPVITGIDAERKKRAEYYTRLMQNLGGFTTALMGQLGTHAPAIGGAYSDAASAIGQAGTGYGNALNAGAAANATAANTGVLSAIGAPEGQALVGGTEAGSALAGLAGWIPSTLLNTQGGAFASAAAQLPKSASIEAQYTMKGIVDKALEEEEDFSTEITKLLQGIPGIKAEAKSAAAQLSFKKQEFALKKLDAQREWYIDQAKLAMLAGDKARSNAYLKLAQQQEQRMTWESQGRDATGNPRPGYHEDPTGVVVKDGWKIGKDGTPVETGKGGKGGKGGSTSSTVPGTPAYKAAARKAVGKARSNMNKDIQAMIRKPTREEVARGADPRDMITPKWQEAYQTLFAAYKYLAVNPETKRMLDQVIRAALKAAGIKPGKDSIIRPGGPAGPPAPPGTPGA